MMITGTWLSNEAEGSSEPQCFEIKPVYKKEDGQKVAPEKAAVLGVPMRRAASVRRDSRAQSTLTQELPPISAPTSLPEGWRALTDPVSSRIYYLDDINCRTQWYPPTEPAQRRTNPCAGPSVHGAAV